MDELLASGLLTGDGTALQFRHEIARLAVEAAVTAHRRSALHAPILASLRALGCDDARMAFYAEAAGVVPAALPRTQISIRSPQPSHRASTQPRCSAVRVWAGPGRNITAARGAGAA